MNHHIPPSPAPSVGELPSGFQQLIQHNVEVPTSHPREQQLPMESIHVASYPNSRYGTPVPQGDLYAYPHPPFSHENSPYGPLPEDVHVTSNAYSTPATSPPTPSGRATDAIATRRGMRLPRGAGSVTSSSTAKTLAPRGAGVQKAGASKTSSRKKKGGNEAQNTELALKVATPLSKSTPEAEAKLAEIAAYVGRPTETRLVELQQGKNPGKIKRPMNAFMLYRKVFQDDARKLTSETNHQILSKVCGISWRNEDESLSAQFRAWAEMERQNHALAHPDYKFTPSKSSKAKPRRGGGAYDDEAEAEGSDIGDLDWNNDGTYRGRGGPRVSTPFRDPDGEYQPPRGSGTPFVPRSVYPLMNAMSQPVPGYPPYESKHMPHPYDMHSMAGAEHYYRPMPHQQSSHGMMVHEDSRSPSPSIMYAGGPGVHPTHGHHPQAMSSLQYDMGPSPHAMAAMPHHAQMGHVQPHYAQAQQAMQYEQRIDPSLMGQYPDMVMPPGAGHGRSIQRQSQTPDLYGGEVDNMYQGAFVGIDEMLQGDVLLKGEAEDWQVQPLEDLDSTAWMDPLLGGHGDKE
ncbi:hypothetical protein P8C59_007905 [Phyllachora maydis]|uniref:HMG box domain-containing protein n=1 Tax=Phyllachora maydis TaxID=1825666 RepID=A0AAD9MEN3_9PEZI|nr:hypothetical protein P8C59_007905 [Phyllachora maydis]